MVQFEMPKSNKKIIAIDFDGTIINNHYPVIENPNMNVIRFIKENRKKYIWILWTCRYGDKLREAVEYMKAVHGIKFDFVNKNTTENILKWGVDTRKIYADYYIDDRSVRNLKEIME